MTDLRDMDLDAALDALAREVSALAPMPGADLVARTMADAEQVAAEASLEAALGVLADEMAEAAPVPGDDLIARVLADAARTNAGAAEAEVDAMLAALAAEVSDAAPAPSEALMARVLADAGEIAANRAVHASAAEDAGLRPVRLRGRFRLQIRTLFMGWQGGAMAAVALAFAIGIGLGNRLDNLNLPLVASVQETTDFMVADVDQDDGGEELL